MRDGFCLCNLIGNTYVGLYDRQGDMPLSSYCQLALGNLLP